MLLHASHVAHALLGAKPGLNLNGDRKTVRMRQESAQGFLCRDDHAVSAPQAFYVSQFPG